MLPVGSRLDRYEIVSLLGKGGMGEVYRARDPRLNREVAVKVLRAPLAGDAESVRRFQQEAEAAGRLNHPNILAVYDVGQHEGVLYLVSELLEGETLGQRLARGPLPLRQVVEVGLQIARGLAAAHDGAIVHRDLKPDNIFLNRDGSAKTLDFGLAKLLPRAAVAPSDLTLTASIQSGTVLGTLGYMSPEQARGLDTDHRTDIFSFGAILYEMASGRRAFGGATAADMVTAVLKEDPPPLTEVSSEIPPALSRMVAHALEKEPSRRFQCMHDLAFALASAGAAATEKVPSVPAPGPQRRWFALGAAASVLLAGFLAYKTWLATPAPVAPPASAPVEYQRVTDFLGVEDSPAISADGRSVVLSAGGPFPQLMVRLLAGGPPLKITHADRVAHLQPRWAPDSASIIYFSPGDSPEEQGAIFEISALGGTPRRLATALGGGDVSHDGKRLAFFVREDNAIRLVVTDRDGANRRVVAAMPANFGYGHVRWSPDDRLLAYQRELGFENDLFTVDANGGTPQQVTREARRLAGFSWLPDGSGFVYSSSRGTTSLYLPTMNLWSVKRDSGDARQLTFGEYGYVEPDLDTKGHVVATRLRRDFNIWKFPIAGAPAENNARAVQVTLQTSQVQTPSLSPDDREMVYLSDQGGHTNLWVLRLDGTPDVRQITFERDPSVSIGVPVWSPDGSMITFFTRRPGTANGDQWLVAPDGANLRRLTDDGGFAAWSADGQWLYVTPAAQGDGSHRIIKLPVAGGEPVQVRSDSAFIGAAPGPDGRSLYFLRMRSRVAGGQDVEIHVAAPEGSASTLLATIPAWRWPRSQLAQPVTSPDGKWLSLMLADGHTTNLYLLPTSGGPLRQVTDFGNAATDIARRVSWSADSRHIYAAVARMDADIILLTNLLEK